MRHATTGHSTFAQDTGVLAEQAALHAADSAAKPTRTATHGAADFVTIIYLLIAKPQAGRLGKLHFLMVKAMPHVQGISSCCYMCVRIWRAPGYGEM